MSPFLWRETINPTVTLSSHLSPYIHTSPSLSLALSLLITHKHSLYIQFSLRVLPAHTGSEWPKNGKKKYFLNFSQLIYKGALCILRYLFFLYKSTFSNQANEYAPTVEWNYIVFNVQNVANVIRNLDIALEVYYMDNGNVIYCKHM